MNLEGQSLPEITTKSAWERLPKVTWEKREDGIFDYKMPDGDWGFRSSNIGNVDWEDELCRESFLVYATVMEVPQIWDITHDVLLFFGGLKQKEDPTLMKAIADFNPIQDIARAMVGSSDYAAENAEKFIADIIEWVNTYSHFFIKHIEQEELAAEPGSFVIENMSV